MSDRIGNAITKGEVMPSDDVIGAQKLQLQRSCCVLLATKPKTTTA